MNTSYIALGSNLSEREEFLSQALSHLQEHPSIEIRKKSSVYETVPVGYTDQNDFLNMVVKVETTLTPIQLLDICQSIETELGRERVLKWGPRTIDLDLLLYNEEHMKSERLTLPHPHMHERAFVMVPFAEIAPDLPIPFQDGTARQIADRLPGQDVIVWGKI